MAKYRFNGLTLNTGTRRIEGPDGSVHLPPKPFEILIELLKEPGNVVTREALLERVWPERPASDETLSRAVADLRKFLNDDSHTPRYIETVPKVGYRLLAHVDSPAPAGRRRAWRTAALLSIAFAAALAVFVFLSVRDSYTDRARVEGGMLQPLLPLTSNVGDEDVPDFSPDGRMLVYAARDRGDENWDIRLRELETGNTQTLVKSPERDYAPAFAPDGRHVVFLRYHGEQCTLIVANLRGDERPVGECRTPLMAYADWTQDGRMIAFSDSVSDGSRVALKLLDVATGEVTGPVPEPQPHELQFAPKFSPDGHMLAFIQGGLDRNEIWLAEPGTGDMSQLTRLGGRMIGLTWNGDGSALYFSTAPPQPAIWRIEPGGEPARIHAGEAYGLAYDGVNDRMVFDQIRQRTNIWVTDIGADGNAVMPMRRIASTRIDNSPSVSPDGSRLAFVSDRTGGQEVWLADANTSTIVEAGTNGDNLRRLTEWDATTISRPEWSPRGGVLAYSVLRDGQWTGYLHRLDGSAPRRLIGAASEIRDPVWSADGSWLLYGGDAGIRRVSPSEPRDEEVVPIPGATPLFEHDGVLYYLRPDRPGIERLGPEGSESTMLAQFDLVFPAAVSHAGDRIHFIATSPEDGTRRLYISDLAGNELRPLLSLVAFTRHAHVSVSPDGRRIFYSQTEDVESDLVLLEQLP